jgi:hypothetical protein
VNLFETLKPTGTEKDVVVRYRESAYLSVDGTINHKHSFRVMKAMSDPDLAMAFLADMRETPDGLEYADDLEHTKLYRVVCIIDGTDFESGQPDIWHWKLVPYVKG